MTTHELAKRLLETVNQEIFISVDMSTCSEDAHKRLFATPIDIQETMSDTALLCELSE